MYDIYHIFLEVSSTFCVTFSKRLLEKSHRRWMKRQDKHNIYIYRGEIYTVHP